MFIWLHLILLFASVHESSECDSDKPEYGATIKTDNTVIEVDRNYLSITIDCSLVKKRWQAGRFDFNSVRLYTLLKALAPGYLRLGGTSCNFLIYDEQEPNTDDPENLYDWDRILKGYENISALTENKFILNGEGWDNINIIAKKSGFKFLFFLNSLLRKNERWDSSNAEKIFKRSIAGGYSDNQAYGLGNEPNSLGHAIGYYIEPEKLSDDYNTLKRVLNSTEFSKHYGNTMIIGPEVTQHKYSAPVFLKKFLPGVKHFISSVTCHHYYLDGLKAKLEDFLDTDVMDTIKIDLNRLSEAIYSVMPRSTPIMLSETSSAYGGGTKGLSDRYAAGFLWLDKLGLAALLGWKVVIRQTLYGARYSLLTSGLHPLPDYWLSLLYKRLVGTKVLEFKKNEGSSELRCYAHCTNMDSANRYKEGAVTMYCLNVNSKEVKFRLEGFENESVDAYILTPSKCGEEPLVAQFADLNGKKLKMVDDETLPPLDPVTIEKAKDITLQSRSLAFFVFPNINAKACIT